MSQLMPLPFAVSCFTKVQIGFTFLVPAYPGSPGKRAIKWVCVCVCGCIIRASKTKRSAEEVISESENQSKSVPLAHTNGVRELSETTRFYVPPVLELPQPRTVATDANQDVTLSQKTCIPEVFSRRLVFPLCAPPSPNRQHLSLQQTHKRRHGIVFCYHYLQLILSV